MRERGCAVAAKVVASSGRELGHAEQSRPHGRVLALKVSSRHSEALGELAA
jgi:hypothetical protein